MRSTRIIGAAVLAVSGLVLTGVTGVSASATQKTEITDVNPSHPIKGETFHVKGTITTHITRGVDLERRFHDTWKVVTSSSTNDAGAFDFTTSATSKRTYRVVAHSLTLDSHTYKRRVTPSETVTPVSQTAKVTLSDTTPAVGQDFTIKGTFTPIRHYRAGAILISTTKNPADAASSFNAFENSLGKFVVSLTPNEANRGTYYFFAAVKPANGAPAKISAPVKVVVH